MYKKTFLILLPIVFFQILLVVLGSKSARAQSYDAVCVGNAVGEYVNDVLDEFDGPSFGDIYFLSPAFNATEPQMAELIGAMNVDFSRFHAVAGNAYNINGTAPISQWVTGLSAATGNPERIVLTEAGWFYSREGPGTAPPPDRPAEVAFLASQLQGLSSQVEAALLFNVFATGGSEFEFHEIYDDELNQICGGSCGRIGANSAAYYSSGDDFYGRAGSHGMGYTLEIATNDTNRSFPSLMPGLEAAHSRGAIPIVRIGVGASSGGFDEPELLADFIRDLDQLVDYPVYVIIGPNEPNSECWASPQCGCELSDEMDIPITFYGQVRTSLPTLDEYGRTVSEAPVRGAAIALYEGTRLVDSGNEYGLVHKYSEIATDGKGEYVIQGVRRAYGGSHDNAIWLYIFCGNVVVDRWKMDLSSEYRRKDFSVACSSNNYDPTPIPPNSVQLNAIGPQLQCAPGNSRNYSSFRQRGLGPGQSIPIPLLREDIDEQFLGCADYPDCLPPSTVYMTNEELLGRTGISRVSGTYDNTFSQIMGTYGIGPTHPWLKGQDDPALALHRCEKARYANATLSEENDPYKTNSHQQYGFGSNLSDPGLWERLYVTKDLQEYACLDNNGTPVKWCEIEPPKSFSNSLREPSCGEFKLHSDYFPYLALVGDPYQGSNTHGVFEPTEDSYTPDNVLEASRDERFQDSWFGLLSGDTDAPYASEDLTFWPGGKPELSKNSVQIISDPAVAQEEGLEGALGGVFSTPFEVFGYDSATSESNSALAEGAATTSNIVQTGTGDFQIRPYEMCTCSANDHTCTAEFNNFVHNDERHDWVGTYRYLTELGIGNGGSGGFFSRLCAAVLNAVGISWVEINACSIATLQDKERTDLSLYGGAPVPAPGDLLAQIEGATMADWTCRTGNCTYDNNGICRGDGCGFLSDNPTCVPHDWRTTNSACWDSGWPCRVFDCIEQTPAGNWVKCDDVDNGASGCSYDSVCGDTQTCSPSGSYSCAWEIEDSYGPYGTGSWAGNGACIGDLIAGYASTAEYWAHAAFNFAPSLASLESALMFQPPFENLSISGTGATSDEPVMWERDTNRASQAFNATGPSGAPVYGGHSMYPFADIYYNSNLTAPQWGEQLPDPDYQGNGSGQAGTGNNGGTGGTGGSCGDTGGGEPEPLDPPWEDETPFPETGELTRYGVGLFEQVWQNRVAWGQVTPCPECYTSEGWQRLIATKRVGDINRRVCLNVPNVGWYGPFLVADVARQDHAACLEGRGWVADLDYDSFADIANLGGYSLNAPIDGATIDEASSSGGTYVCP